MESDHREAFSLSAVCDQMREREKEAVLGGLKWGCHIVRGEAGGGGREDERGERVGGGVSRHLTRMKATLFLLSFGVEVIMFL